MDWFFLQIPESKTQGELLRRNEVTTGSVGLLIADCRLPIGLFRK
jgi:hypothetical protein